MQLIMIVLMVSSTASLFSMNKDNDTFQNDLTVEKYMTKNGINREEIQKNGMLLRIMPTQELPSNLKFHIVAQLPNNLCEKVVATMQYVDTKLYTKNDISNEQSKPESETKKYNYNTKLLSQVWSTCYSSVKNIFAHEFTRGTIAFCSSTLAAGHLTYNIGAPLILLPMPSYYYTLLWSSVQLLSVSLGASLPGDAAFVIPFSSVSTGMLFGAIYCSAACIALNT